MGHSITLIGIPGLVDEATLGEFIDIFFGCRDSNFVVKLEDSDPPNENIRGSLAATFRGFTITIWVKNIQAHMQRGLRLGGNLTFARDVRHGVYLVLAHELRHAHQFIFHGHSRALNAGGYLGRASEVDARRFVDESYESICAFVDVDPIVPGVSDPISEVVDALACHTERVSSEMIWEHVLPLSGDMNLNYGLVLHGLIDRGVKFEPCSS